MGPGGRLAISVTTATIARGDLVLVDLHGATGREQLGLRPCVIMSADQLVSQLRFPLAVVVPFTSNAALGTIYPVVQPYPGGLVKPSTALIDNIRGIDKTRVVRQYSAVPDSDFKRIERAVASVLGLRLVE
jgi:mRNA interferase MazF